MRFFIPLAIFLGVLMGFVSGPLSHLLSRNSKTHDRDLNIALLFFGGGMITGAWGAGKAYDKLKFKVFLCGCITLSTVTLIV